MDKTHSHSNRPPKYPPCSPQLHRINSSSSSNLSVRSSTSGASPIGLRVSAASLILPRTVSCLTLKPGSKGYAPYEYAGKFFVPPSCQPTALSLNTATWSLCSSRLWRRNVRCGRVFPHPLRETSYLKNAGVRLHYQPRGASAVIPSEVTNLLIDSLRAPMVNATSVDRRTRLATCNLMLRT